MVDITNLLAFLQSMPKEINPGVNIASIESLLVADDHVVHVQIVNEPSRIPFGSFMFWVTRPDLLRISHSRGITIDRKHLERCRELIRILEKRVTPLGKLHVHPKRSGRLMLVADYSLAVSDRWFTGNLRGACRILIAQSMVMLMSDIEAVVAAAKKL